MNDKSIKDYINTVTNDVNKSYSNVVPNKENCSNIAKSNDIQNNAKTIGAVIDNIEFERTNETLTIDELSDNDRLNHIARKNKKAVDFANENNITTVNVNEEND